MADGADISEFMAGLAEGARRQVEAAILATEVYGAHVAGDAQEGAPVDTGALAGSGTWSEAVMQGDVVFVEVGFNTNYAAAVHEIWQPGTPGSKNGNPLARPKFLEMSLRENAEKFGPFVADRMKAAADAQGNAGGEGGGNRGGDRGPGVGDGESGFTRGS